MGISHRLVDGIAEIVIDVPPVNALASTGWFELADVVTELGKDPDCRVGDCGQHAVSLVLVFS